MLSTNSKLSEAPSERSISGYEADEPSKPIMRQDPHSKSDTSVQSIEDPPAFIDSSAHPSSPLPHKPEKQLSEKSHQLGANLSEYETHLFEYSSFSLMEEIDLSFCKFKNIDLFKTAFTEDTLTDRIMYTLEVLEQQLTPAKESETIQ